MEKYPFPTEFALAEHAKQSKELIQAEYDKLVEQLNSNTQL